MAQRYVCGTEISESVYVYGAGAGAGGTSYFDKLILVNIFN